MDLYAAASDQIYLTVRDVRALARAALSVVQPEAEDPVPQRLLAAIRGLARATEALASYLQTWGDPDETRHLALGAATDASTLLEEDENLARSLGVNALVDQIHSCERTSTERSTSEVRLSPGPDGQAPPRSSTRLFGPVLCSVRTP